MNLIKFILLFQLIKLAIFQIETSIDYGSDANSNIYKSWKDTRSNDFGLTKK